MAFKLEFLFFALVLMMDHSLVHSRPNEDSRLRKLISIERQLRSVEHSGMSFLPRPKTEASDRCTVSPSANHVCSYCEGMGMRKLPDCCQNAQDFEVCQQILSWFLDKFNFSYDPSVLTKSHEDEEEEEAPPSTTPAPAKDGVGVSRHRAEGNSPRYRSTVFYPGYKRSPLQKRRPLRGHFATLNRVWWKGKRAAPETRISLRRLVAE